MQVLNCLFVPPAGNSFWTLLVQTYRNTDSTKSKICMMLVLLHSRLAMSCNSALLAGCHVTTTEEISQNQCRTWCLPPRQYWNYLKDKRQRFYCYIYISIASCSIVLLTNPVHSIVQMDGWWTWECELNWWGTLWQIFALVREIKMLTAPQYRTDRHTRAHTQSHKHTHIYTYQPHMLAM